jgi:putative ABC transport system ATP-binding protein
MDIELESVTKHFGGRKIVDIPSLRLEGGAQYAITGESGSGKSTLLNLLAGVLLPTSGSLRLGGAALQEMSERERDFFRSRRIGYIFQTFNLLPELTVLENIRLPLRFSGRHKSDESLVEMLDRVGLAGKASVAPGRLSVGQRQRVAVLRALVHDPELILADEPTGSLDQGNREKTLDLLLELCREGKRTLLLVTHDLAVAARFGHVLSFHAVNRAEAG